MKQHRIYIAALVLIIGFSHPLFAQEEMQPGYGYGMGPGMMHGGMMGPGMMGQGMMGGFGMINPDMMGAGMLERFRTMLNLSENQLSRLRNLRLEYIRQTSPIQADLRIARAELANTLSMENPRMQEVEEKIRQVANQQADILLNRIRFHMQTRDVLTDEQRERLESLFSQGVGPRRMDDDERPLQRRGMPDMH